MTFLYAASFLATGWGIAHLYPTKDVVAGFGDISQDNRHIITMEWIVEGVALIFIGVLLAVVTAVDPSGQVSRAIYAVTAAGLLALALVALFTGFKIKFLPFRLCPFVLTASGVFVILGLALSG